MQLHQLERPTSYKTKKRVGRGGARGKTAGRGHKGQKAHSGGAPRPEIRDRIKKLPKLRGHGVNRARTVNPDRPQASLVTLAQLDRTFAPNEQVTPQALHAKKLITKRGGSLPLVKIVANGALTKPLTVAKCSTSAAAKRAIEAQGGSTT